MPVTTDLMHPVPVAKGMKAIDKYTSHVMGRCRGRGMMNELTQNQVKRSYRKP